MCKGEIECLDHTGMVFGVLIWLPLITPLCCLKHADVAELEYAPGLDPAALEHEGSTPSVGTRIIEDYQFTQRSILKND
jgi:hypothetical protein